MTYQGGSPLGKGTGPGLPEPDALASIWQRRALVAVFVVLLAGAGWMVAERRTPTYAAEASVLLADPQADGSRAARDEERFVADQVALMRSARVTEQAAALGGAAVGAEALARGATIEATEGSNLIVVRFTAADPDGARAGANAIVDGYRSIVRAQTETARAQELRRLDGAIADARRLARDRRPAIARDGHVLAARLERRRADLRLADVVDEDGVALLQPADEVTRQGASTRATVAVAGIIGLLLGCALAVALGARRRQFLDPGEPEALVGAPLSGVIPDFGREAAGTRLPALGAPAGRAANEFRFLASGLMPPVIARGGADLVAFVGASPGDGTTSLVANTAYAAAQGARKVLAVDVDVETGALSRLLLGGEPEAGPGDAGGDFGEAVRAASPVVPRWVIGTRAGGVVGLLAPPDAGARVDGFLQCAELVGAVGLLREHFDLILADVPPLLDSAYASAILQRASGVILVVPHRAEVASVEQAVARLSRLGITPAGYVYNERPRRARRHAGPAEAPAGTPPEPVEKARPSLRPLRKVLGGRG